MLFNHILIGANKSVFANVNANVNATVNVNVNANVNANVNRYLQSWNCTHFRHPSDEQL